MKRVFSIIIMLLIVLTISGCSNDKSISSTTEDKDSNQINDVETKRYDIDDIYNKLKEFDFNNMRLVDLNYNQINETTIIV
ncbi:MAG: hypothetical protein RR048_01865 [Oscillospiraceae bacterium]